MRKLLSRYLWLVGLAGIVSVIGCAAEDPATGDSVPSVPRSEALVDLRIGAAEGPESEIFARLADVAVSEDGTIYVADTQLDEVRRYDASGGYEGLLGRKGEGPGEYLSPSNVEALPGGGAAVLARAGQVLVFDAAGEHISSFRVANLRSREQPRFTLRVSRDATLAVPVYDADSEEHTAAEERWNAGRYATHVAQLSQEGEELARHPLPPARPTHIGFVVPRAEGTLMPFPVRTLYAWSPLGYPVHGRNDAYFIQLSAEGREVTIQRTVEPAGLAPGERELWLGFVGTVKERFAQLPPEALGSSERPSDDWIPETKPFFRTLYVDDDGRIWVHRYVEAELWDPPPPPPTWSTTVFAWREPSTFDVFEPDGSLLGTVVLPRLTRLTQVSNDTIWGIQEDLDGVHYVVRMRVTPPLGSLGDPASD